MLYSLWVRRYAPFDSFGGGYEGDGARGASTSMAVTARTIGGCSFGPGSVGPGTAKSSGTDHFLWPFSRAHAKVNADVSVQTSTTSTVRFILHTEGANPLAPPGAPDIDTFIHMSATFGPTAMHLDGEVRGDDFPNAEVFIYDGTGQSMMLFEFATDGGRNSGPFTRLFGAHSDQVIGSFCKHIALRSNGAIR